MVVFGGVGGAPTGYERPHIVTDSICAGLDPGKKYPFPSVLTAVRCTVMILEMYVTNSEKEQQKIPVEHICSFMDELTHY